MSQATVVRSGLVGLVRGVRAYFDANGVTAAVSLGWTQRYRQDNQGSGGANRVIFISGETDGSAGPPKVLKGGELDRDGAQNFVAVNANNERIRALAWWHRIVTVSVWAADPASPQDEELQIEATDALLESTLQALHNGSDPDTGQYTGGANIEHWGAVAYTTPPVEAAFGREYMFQIVILEGYFDAAVGMAYPGGAVGRGRVT